MGIEIKTVGVIGAGQMGSGIAHVCSLAGFNVRLNDLSEERINAGLATINGNMARQVSKEAITDAERQAALAPDQAGPDLRRSLDLRPRHRGGDRERGGEAQDLHRALPVPAPGRDDRHQHVVDLDHAARRGSTDRPERFIGIHFMNPVPVMQLVELIRGIATEDPTYESAKEFIGKLGKTTTVSEDFPAFIVNRILLPMINEAIYTLYEGVGSVEAIDTAMRLGANHPMGPLQLADFIGLDTCLSVMQVLHEGLADSKYRPCPLLVKYVEAGWLGRKTKRGFYDYRGEKPVPTR